MIPKKIRRYIRQKISEEKFRDEFYHAKHTEEKKPNLFFYDPLSTHNAKLNCPVDNGKMLDQNRWTTGTDNSFKPRKVYDNVKNAMLVSKIYKCSSCGKRFAAHAPEMFQQTHQSLPPGLIILKKCAVTSALYNHTVNAAVRGNLN